MWEQITIDFVEGLPKSNGRNTMLVVVDHLTKYAHLLPPKHPFLLTPWLMKFVKEIVRLHGFPIFIISNQDKLFMSNFWRELFRLQGTYHPQTDGQYEVVNKTLETYLRCFINGQPKKWRIEQSTLTILLLNLPQIYLISSPVWKNPTLPWNGKSWVNNTYRELRNIVTRARCHVRWAKVPSIRAQ